MRVALLIGANPRLVKSGPICILDSDKEWDFVGENVKDTEYALNIHQDPTRPEHKKVSVSITKIGTEPYISIFAVSL